MIRWLIGAGFLLLFVAFFLLMRAGWKGRGRRQAGITAPTLAPQFLLSESALQAATAVSDLFYVATTKAADRLDRIVVGGLGFRGRAIVSVHSQGVVLDIAGSEALLIAAADLRDVGRSTWTIDRVVETDGLIRLGWRLGDLDVDTYLRSDEPDELLAAIRTMLAAQATDTTQEKTQ
ncbi:hypothetical protein EDF46_0402 [Frondihabitans sp. PhB188]|uniref:PH-like domain-containing protein n=1 Tax=Frondihabitans sp. PhB188 TaxID=2485200 RepID=UPI000F46A14D|nr:hypothetical protein [Frondihabitans sp. PhB188]ROQ41035.1 hypothetical protein EDF46_0402 [Frondihabitans sp. PhB188]